MMVHLKKVADEVKLPLNDPQKAYNTRLAQEVGKWAGEQGKGSVFHNTVFKAYFVDAQNISDPLVLINLAESVGFSRKDAKHVIDNRTFKEAVDRDWSRSHEMSVTSVPTFILKGRRLVGAQPYDTLRQFTISNTVTVS
jgi:predicted DsbA family dithiol-disulfide isomerase